MTGPDRDFDGLAGEPFLGSIFPISFFVDFYSPRIFGGPFYPIFFFIFCVLWIFIHHFSSMFAPIFSTFFGVGLIIREDFLPIFFIVFLVVLASFFRGHIFNIFSPNKMSINFSNIFSLPDQETH